MSVLNISYENHTQGTLKTFKKGNSTTG